MRVLCASILALCLIAPAAAHTTTATDDGRYLLTVGNTGEPVYTFQRTGLDFLVRMNTTDREPVANVHLQDLDLTLVAPDGSELPLVLRAQFGEEGRYTGTQAYTLTQPGEYFLRIEGELFGTPVDITSLVGSGPIGDQGEIYFPDTDVSDLIALQARIDGLQEEVDALTLIAEQGGASEEAPGSGAVLLFVGLAAAVLWLRRGDGS